MRFLSKSFVLASVFLGVLPSSPALASTAGSDIVIIREDEVIEEDLYSAGYRIDVHGRIEGDLLAAAVGEVFIDGSVTGSVTAIAKKVTITGVVEGSVRVLAQEVIIDGAVIGGDLAATAWKVNSHGEIGRDVFVFARELTLGGTVARMVKGNQHRTTLEGQFLGDVETQTGKLIMVEGTRIAGDLYYAGDPVVIGSFDGVEGSVVKRNALPMNIRIRAMILFGGTLAILLGLLGGLLVIWLGRNSVTKASERLGSRPGAAFVWGLALVLSPFVVGALVVTRLVTASPEAAFPAALVMIPILVILFSFLAVAVALAPITVAAGLGGLIIKEKSIFARFLLGYLILVVLLIVPFLGGLTILVV